MRPLSLLFGLLAYASPSFTASPFSEQTDSTTISIQSLSLASSPITPLASIAFNPSSLSASLENYDPPLLSESASYFRIGVYDPATSSWKSSTSLASKNTFEKGYRPTITLSLGSEGEVLGVAVKSSAIDAGQTRDFSPVVQVRKMVESKAPSLNRPVVVSEDGRVEEAVVEKSFLQKYWWLLLAGVMLLVTAGGGPE